MMIRINGNIWLIRIQPSPTPRDHALAPREDVGRRQPDRRRQQRRHDRDLEAVDGAPDELVVLLGQREPEFSSVKCSG